MSLALAPGRCVMAQMPHATCAACIEACPQGALDVAAGGIALAAERCSGCGHCAAACPQAALSLPNAPSPVLDEQGCVALVACARAPGAPARVAVCAQALSLGDLAQLWLGGIRTLALATGGCETCPDAPRSGADLPTRLGQINALLAARGLAQIEARIAPASALRQPRPNRSRRALLGLLATAPRLDAAAALKAVQHLPAAPGQSALFAFAPGIDPARCTGCNACTRICPENALIRVKDFDTELRYTSDPAACTGCGLCHDICDEGAASVFLMSEISAPVALVAYTCRVCRAPSHHPRAEFAAEAICPACRVSGHHRAPVLVLP